MAEKYIGKIVTSRLNIRSAPAGEKLYRTLGAGTEIEADQVLRLTSFDGNWLHLTLVNGNPVTEAWWIADGRGTETYVVWQAVTVPDGGGEEPQPPAPAPALKDLPISITLGDDVSYEKQVVEVVLKAK